MPNKAIKDIELYFETTGNGAPLVLIPGFASGIWSWKYQIEPLSASFQVVTFDPRGISRSPVSADARISIELIADDIAALLDHLDIAKASILGISFGGFVAQSFALKFPNRLDRLVLACTSYGGKGHVPPSLEVLAAFASTKGLNSSERIRQYLTMAFTPEFVADSPRVVDDFCYLREQNIVPESVYMDQLVSATTFDFSTQVREVEAETLVLTGDCDTIVPMENSVNLAAAMKNARLKTIHGGSHMFFVEQYEVFNSAVSDFLTGKK